VRAGRTYATLLVRIGGNAEAVQVQLGQLRAIGEARDAPDRVWDLLRSSEPRGAVAFRLSRLPTRFSESWRDAMQLLDGVPDAYCHGDPGRGVVRCVIPSGAGADSSTLRRCVTSPFSGTRIVETLPAELWPLVAPSAASDRLARGIKRAFDPDRVMNPGILGEAE
jgi:FAD/FMN-containing dehydrogenase